MNLTVDTEQTNPAGRLYTIVSRVIEESRIRGDIAAGHLWAAVFQIPAKHGVPMSGGQLYEVISRLLQLRKLIDETEESLRKIEGLPERYFRPFPRIRALPERSFVSLASNIVATIKEVTEGDMTVLEFCSEKLEAQHTERIVDEDELASILEDVDVLFNKVHHNSLDAELKTFILDGLESIRRGIYEFRIRGPQRLKETMAEIIGNLIVNHDVIHAARKQDADSVGSFEKLFYRVAAVVSFANDGPALLSAVKTALLPSGG